MINREYHIHHIPVFVFGETEPEVDIPSFCEQIVEMLPRNVLRNVDVCYISDNPVLDGRNAAYNDGAIYMKLDEPTNEDMIENFVHEVAHAVELDYPHFIYDDRLIAEFAGKRSRLYHILTAEGYDQMPQRRYDYLEYNEAFDNFLANVVGYPTLLNITMGLFCSPYAATSIQEYFANGFEKYFTESPRYVKSISPVLYQKVVAILNDDK
tara:strand:- start:121 stop:750 length:630 start_codon:yes stop_codon:yes gene_type:complete